jgi:hypothetical protein
MRGYLPAGNPGEIHFTSGRIVCLRPLDSCSASDGMVHGERRVRQWDMREMVGWVVG